ncbi:unnamed protein product, partial [Musa acuminata var. zebrina]
GRNRPGLQETVCRRASGRLRRCFVRRRRAPHNYIFCERAGQGRTSWSGQTRFATVQPSIGKPTILPQPTQTPFPPSLLRYLLLRSSSVDRDTESSRGGLLPETRGSLCCYRLACSNRDVLSQAQPTAASAQSRFSFVLLE